jgi:uncharacterized protein YqjF (DUF2071 family)
VSSRTAEHRVGIPVATERWSTVTFLHWQCASAVIQPRLPSGVTVDEYDGSAWLTITPFVLSGIRPLGGPVVPDCRSLVPRPGRQKGLMEIRGINLRTYVHGPDGRDGLYFLSQDTSSMAFAVVARVFLGAPYHWGRLAVEQRDGAVSYTGARLGSRVSHRLSVRPGDGAEPDARNTWLTGRWRAYTRRAGRLLVTPVQHEPWPLRTATVELLEQTLTSALDLPGPVRPLVHFSDGVHQVRNGFTRPL